jgi:hypothetical protein
MLDEASPHVGAEAGVEQALRIVLRSASARFTAELAREWISGG